MILQVLTHCFALSFGKSILDVCVLMLQHSTLFVSCGVPSPSRFFKIIELSLGMKSFGSSDRKVEWTASWAACWPLLAQSLVSNITDIISSMYPSTVAGRYGTSTKSSLAGCGSVVCCGL